jgi:undecaprenyl-diphosphatase
MDLWLLQFLNGAAGWGYWTDYLAWFVAVFGLAFQAAFATIRWFWPGARPRRRERHAVMLAAGAAIFAVGMAQMPSVLIYRPRPHVAVPGVFDLIGLPPSESFPSIHSAAAFTIATVMGWESQLWGWLNWPLAFGIGWSRIYAGVHYPTDILASLILGFLVGWAFMELRADLTPALNRIMSVLPFGIGKR